MHSAIVFTFRSLLQGNLFNFKTQIIGKNSAWNVHSKPISIMLPEDRGTVSVW